MIVTAEELIGLNNNFKGDTISFQGIDCEIEVNHNWKQWVVNFLSQLKEIRRERNDSNEYYYRLIDNIEEWYNDVPLPVFCNRIVYDNNKWEYLPPCIDWISPSGRFAAIDLGLVLDIGNYKLLWDIQNEELMKLEFHDLEGINEKHGVLYCRTHNEINPIGYNFPLRFDTGSINSFNNWKRLDSENKDNAQFFNESEKAQELVLRIFGTENYRKFDLSNSNLGEIIFKTEDEL